MTENNHKRLLQMEEKLYRLLFLYKEMKAQNIQLSASLKEKEEQCAVLTAQCETLKKDYANLKQAKIITLSVNEISITRERINKLVREIDRCIESLNK